MAPANVKQEGACGEAYWLEFVSSSQLTWSHYSVNGPPYNLYRKMLGERPPADYGDCTQTGIMENTTLFEEDPAPGELWLLQITSDARDGGDSMGYETSSCSPRTPSAWCSQ
jgi:hypothetical protein